MTVSVHLVWNHLLQPFSRMESSWAEWLYTTLLINWTAKMSCPEEFLFLCVSENPAAVRNSFRKFKILQWVLPNRYTSWTVRLPIWSLSWSVFNVDPGLFRHLPEVWMTAWRMNTLFFWKQWKTCGNCAQNAPTSFSWMNQSYIIRMRNGFVRKICDLLPITGMKKWMHFISMTASL